MESVKQVCNLDLSKQLEELSVEQDSLYSWAHPFEHKEGLKDFFEENFLKWGLHLTNKLCPLKRLEKRERYAAYTIAELETKIFKIIDNRYDFIISYSPTGGTWEGETFNEMYEVQLFDWFDTTDLIKERADTGANVRAKILICLIEHQRDKYTK